MKFRNQKPLLGSLLNREHPLAQGLIFYTPLNEGIGTQLNDLVSGRPITLSGPPAWAADEQGPRLDFTPNQYSQFADDPALEPDSLSLVCRWRADDVFNTGYLANKRLIGGNGWALYLAGNNHYWWVEGVQDFIGVSAGVDYQSVGIITPSLREFYVNQTLVVSTAASGYDKTNTEPLRVGDYVGGGLGFNGKFDFVAMYDRRLLRSDVDWLFAEPYAMLADPDPQRVFFIIAGGIVLLAGTAAAVSSLTGALPVAKKLAATVAATSSLAGALPIDKGLTSTIPAVSSLAGALPVDKGLAATIPVTSSLAGALALEWALAGTVPAASTLAGEITIAGEQLLDGVVVATSTLAGDLPIERLMVSTVAAASTLDAILGKYRAIAGSIDAVSTLTGDLQRLRALAGAIAGGSTLAGALKLQWALRATLAGLATVSGDLTVELGFPWKREQILNAEDISGPALRAPHKEEIE